MNATDEKTAAVQEDAQKSKKAEKAAKKAAIKAALAKSKEADAKKTAKKAGPRVTIDSVTMELVRQPKGVTLEEATKVVVQKFPGHDPKTLANTTKRRLKGYLAQKYDVKIVKDDHGRYSLAQRKTA